MLGFAFIVAVLLCGALKPAGGSSSGDVYDCDAHSGNFGCSSWGIKEDGAVDRLNCTDPNPGHMPWASRPVRTDGYAVRSGNGASEADDPTYYVPNEYLSIFVKVTKYKYKYHFRPR